jgi:hypothetical protein
LFIDFLSAALGRTETNLTEESETVMAIEITGHFEDNGNFVPSPWYSYETDIALLNGRRSGDYSVHFYDINGTEISVAFFDADFHAQVQTEQGIAFVPASRAPVEVIIEFPEHASRIVIRRGDTDLYATDVSKTAPQVAFTGLSDNQQLTDNVTITWEASGETDELFFELWYSPYDDEFYNIASNITGRSFTVDLSELPGTYEGYFYIYATDGVRTGEAYSPWVQVPFKAPRFISTQGSIPEFKITQEILFDADIYDLQDGWLWDVDEVVWTLGGREFMSGSILWVWPYELAPGTHTFTATATNSAGMSVQEEFSFRIIDDETDLPNDWSRDDIRSALSDGFAIDLRRLDMAINRSEFATLMTTMFATMLEEDYDFPEYVEGMVTDSGHDDYDEFLMVYLGVMEAPGGRFDPRGSLTEKEAALIMYRVAALADPEWFWDDATDEDILDWLFDITVIEGDGPNTLQETEPLTNSLALVRLSRLYSGVFE